MDLFMLATRKLHAILETKPQHLGQACGQKRYIIPSCDLGFPLIFIIALVVAVELLSRAQLFCNSMDCSLLGSSVHGILQAKILEWIAISFLLQEIFPTQGLNPGLLHCRQTL